MKQIGKVLGIVIVLGVVALVIYAVLHWISTPPGTFVDWMVGIAATLWLVVIVTVPWNLHFEAKEVIEEARRSKDRNIKVDQKELAFARKVVRISLWIAISLHVLSAATLYALSYYQISIIGYFGAGATLLLTLLRPAIRGYEFLSERLRNLRQEVSYPREDVLSLKHKVDELENTLNYLSQDYNNEYARQGQELQECSHQIKTLQNNLSDLTTSNEKAHQRLADETRHAVAQLSNGQKITFRFRK